MRTQRTKELVDGAGGEPRGSGSTQSAGRAKACIEDERCGPQRNSDTGIIDVCHERVAGSASQRVLLAGNDTDVAHVARLLGGRYAIEIVADGRAALKRARVEPPDLFIVAEADGSTFLSALRADPRLRELPVIILSEGDPTTGDIGDGDDYLFGPFSDHELLTRVSMHLRMLELRREAVAAHRSIGTRLAAEGNALARLNEASSRLWRIQSLSEGLEEMLAATLELLGADMGIAQILDSRSGALILAAQQGFEQVALDLLRKVTMHDHSACGRSLASAERTIIEDVELDPLYAPFRSVARAAGYRAIVSAPLVGRDGAPLGVLSAQFKSPHRPSEQDLRRLDLYARQAADFIERCRSDEALRDSERRFRATFENAAVGIAHVAPDGTLLGVNDRLCQIVGWPAEELTNKSFQGITHPDDLDLNLKLLNRVLAGELDQYAMEKRYRRKDGTTVWGNLTVGCVRKDGGGVDYFISVVEDISERRKAEEQNRLLLREVNHRAKNLLAVIQAVARQTAGVDHPRVFAKLFAARLTGLAASQDLLVKSDWRGVGIGELVRSQLAHFVGLIGTRILPKGPAVSLSPAAAQTIGMALHELATNAGKHGALSNTDGIVNVSWGVTDNGGSQQFAMCWHERGGPPVAPPRRQGFGHTVIVRMVEHALDADVVLDHAPSGLVWRITAPAQSVLDVPGRPSLDGGRVGAI